MLWKILGGLLAHVLRALADQFRLGLCGCGGQASQVLQLGLGSQHFVRGAVAALSRSAWCSAGSR